MVVLADLETAVAADLREVGAGDYTTAQLDRAIDQAVGLYNSKTVLQRELSADVAGDDSRNVDLSSLSSGAWSRIESIEYPVDQWPPSYVRFDIWAQQATLQTLSAVPSTSNVRIRYLLPHADVTTIPDRDFEALALAAAGYALRALAAGGETTLTTQPNVADAASKLARQRIDDANLRLRARAARIRPNRLYRPTEQPPVGRDIVTGP